MSPAPDLSVVVPLLNEEENVGPLVAEIVAVLGPDEGWELILVDDGSTDETVARARRAAEGRNGVRVVRLARRYGQSTAMQAGFDRAVGQVLVTMDGDLQNDPADIPRLVAALDGGYDLAAGYRVDRKDTLVRRLPSRVANMIIRWLTGVSVRDNGCSLKAYRRTLVDRLRLYSDMHRFIPALSVGIAGARIVELPVNHRPRTAGTSKYGLSRVLRVIADLATLKMISSFRMKPLHLFASAAFVAGALGGLVAGISAVVLVGNENLAAWFVLPSVALVWFALAGFLLLVGLLAESVIQVSPTRTARRTGRQGAR